MNRCSNGLVCTTETACQPAQDLLKPEVILNAEQTEILRHPSVPAGKHLTALFYSSDVKHTGNAAKTWIEKQWNLVSRRMTHSGFGPQRCWNWNPQDSSLCSLCSLLKGTKGTKKTFGLIFIQARKFLLNLRVQAGLTKCIFALDFHVFACFSTFLTIDHFLMAQCCKCQFASVWTFKECCDIKMKMNIYFYVLVFFLDLTVYVLFSFKHNKAWAVRTVVSALCFGFRWKSAVCPNTTVVQLFYLVSTDTTNGPFWSSLGSLVKNKASD